MSLIPPQVKIGVALSAAVAVALVSGSAGFGIAWKWRSADVAAVQAELSGLQSTVREVARADSIRSEEATRRLQEMEQTLQARVQLEEYRNEQFASKLADVSSRANVCLSGRTIRVFRAAEGSRANQSPDPARDAGAAAGPSPAAVPGSAGTGGLSEFAVARYLNLCMSKYREAQLRFLSLADRVATLPCVEVVD